MNCRPSLLLIILLFLLPLFMAAVSATGIPKRWRRRTTVTIASEMAEETEPFAIRCKSNARDLGGRDMSPGSKYKWSVVKSDRVIMCGAMWGRRFASWSGFNRSRDGDHGAVYWVVNIGGVFFSWDNSNYKHQADWELY